jgi:acyl-CoA thioesterase-2
VTARVPIREFLALARTDDRLHWHVDIQPRTLTHAGAMHGGALLAVAVEALEGALDRPLVWATAQYLHHVGPTGVIDVNVTPEIEGRNTTQARVALCVGDVEALLTTAALGSRPFPHGGRGAEMPDAPSPDASRPWVGPLADGEQILDHYEIRFARGRMIGELDGTPGPGRAALWCRASAGGPRPMSVGDLALVGDMILPSLSGALGVPAAGNSLDNTLRVVERATTEWVLLDVAVDASADGFAHAGARLWTEDGTLLAIVSQTLVLRDAAPNEPASAGRPLPRWLTPVCEGAGLSGWCWCGTCESRGTRTPR